MSDLTHQDVRRILEIIDGLGDASVSVDLGDLELEVIRGDAAALASGGSTAPPAVASASAQSVVTPAAVPAAASIGSARGAPIVGDVPPGQVAVRAPTIGTFYRAPSPGAAPFVEVGARVGADDTVGVFDVMKLFTSLRAGVAGVVSAILVENAAVVEQDQPLVLITPGE